MNWFKKEQLTQIVFDAVYKVICPICKVEVKSDIHLCKEPDKDDIMECPICCFIL